MANATDNAESSHQRRAHPLVQPMLYFMIAGAIAQAVLGLFTDAVTTLLVPSVCGLVFVACVLLVRAGHDRLASLLALVALLVGIEYAMWVGQGLHDVATMELPIVLLLAVLVLTRRQALFVTALTLTTVAGFGFAEHHHLLPNDEVAMVDPADAYLALIILTAFAALFHFFVYELFRSDQRYAEIFNATHEAIFIHDTQTGRILDVNEPMLRMYGYHREELPHLDVQDLSATSAEFSQERARDLVRKAAAGETQIFEWKAQRKDGSEFWAEVTLRRSEIGGQRRVLAVVRDIDARRHAEDRSRQSEKLRALGQLAGGIAHDFNNQLAGIAGYAQLLSLKNPSSSCVTEHTRDILKATDRAANLTRQLLAFAREDARWAEDVDVNELVTEVVDLVRRSIDPRIEIVFEPSGRELVTRVDPAQTHSAVLNLCLNARDAMPEGGTLAIRTRRSTVELPEAQLNETLPGQYASIEVADTGVGMSPAVLERVFEPFFTTKARGTGMGLATVYGTARGHGGFVHVESELGHGSTFRLLLPLESVPKSAPRDVPQPLGDELGFRVLLAEDDPLVAETTRAMLEELGCTVHACGDGQEAVDAFQRDPGAFDVVLLDLSMPRLSGTEALREIRRIDPNIRVVIMSGFTAETSVESLRAAGAAEFVAKPYAITTLRNALARSTTGS